MSITQVMSLGHDFLWTTLLLAAPTLVISLLVGLVVSILQTITSIQEQTLSFVPRLIAVALTLVLTMGWMLQVAVQFTYRMIWHMTDVVR